MSTIAKLTPVAPFATGKRAFSLHGFLGRSVDAFRRFKAEERTERHLATLTPHLLRDIGLSDAEIRDLRRPDSAFDPADVNRRRLG